MIDRQIESEREREREIYIYMYVYIIYTDTCPSAEGKWRLSPVFRMTYCIHRSANVSRLKFDVVETDACLTCELLKGNSGLSIGARNCLARSS